MATKNLKVDITADASGFTRGTKSAEAAARVMERELNRVEAAQRKLVAAQMQASREMSADFARRAAAEREMARLQLAATREMEADFGRRSAAARSFAATAGMVGIAAGGALALGLGLSARAAMEWESAFAGVRKVVNGSPEQMAQLSDELRGLAKTMPVTATEIAGVAEAAGQLGVTREDIASFTETAVRLGVSTNLSAEDAATGLAKLGNIMGVLPSQVGRAGAALVALGNDGASTEQDILEMATRIAGAGRVVGLSEAQVLGYANALSSLGLDAEAGGTAISRVFLAIDQASRKGGKSLALFAQASGMSAEQFRAAYAKDAAGAVDSFVAGLGRIQASGGNVAATLSGLGLDEIRVRDTLLRVAGASDKLDASVKKGSESWRQQTALVAESNRRFETSESKIAIAKNQLNDAAIDIGGAVLPAFAALAKDVGTAAQMFGDLPGPVKEGAATLGLLAASVGIIGGAAAITVPKVLALQAALGSMGPKGQAAAAGMGRLGGFLSGPAGIGITAGLTVATIALGAWTKKQIEARQRVEELTDAIKADNGAIADNARQAVYSALEQRGAVEAAKLAKVSLDDLTDAALGNADAQARVNAQLAARRAASQGSGRGNDLIDAAVLNSINGESEALEKAVQAYKDRVAAGADATDSSKKSGQAAADEARQQAILAGQIEDTASAIDKLKKAFDGLNGKTLDLRQANRAWMQSLDDVKKSLKENGKTLDVNSEKGRNNAAALDDAAKAAGDRAKAILDSTGNEAAFRASLQQSREKLIAMAVSFGMGGVAAGKYADSVLAIPRDVTTTVHLTGVEAARAKIAGLSRALQNNSGLVAGVYGAAGAHAAGGFIPGPPSTADTVPAWLSTGEYVLNAAAVQRYGVPTLDKMNARKYASGGLVAGTGPSATGSMLSDYQQALGSPVGPTERAEAIRRRADAVRGLQIATMRLHEVEAKRHHTALELARADQAQARARNALGAATANLANVNARIALQQQRPLAQLSSALGRGIKNGAAFVRNIEALAARGFGELARQLAEQGDEDAERIAADAVRSPAAKVAAVQRQAAAASQLQAQREHLGDIARLVDALRARPKATLDDLAGLLGMDVTDLIDLARLAGGALGKLPGGKNLIAQLPARAGGGPVSAGVPYLVGERRPEVFVPDVGGRIIPDARAFGGSTQQITIHAANTEARALAREVVTEVRREAAVRAR